MRSASLPVLLVLWFVAADGVTATGRCGPGRVDCLGFFKTCIWPSDVCDGRSDCRSRIDEDFCECYSDHGCPSGYTCVNQFPVLGKKCKKKLECSSGMRVEGASCVDINECDESVDTCLPDQFCVNTPGSFECICSEPGYRFNETTRQCDDINECLIEALCESPGQCTNTAGSFRCECPQHFVQLSKGFEQGFRCLARDYCEEKNCEAPLQCQNDGHGNAECICPELTHEMRDGHCVDRDECQKPNLCQRVIGGSVCRNLEGSYYCECPTMSASPDVWQNETLEANLTLTQANGVRVNVCVPTGRNQSLCEAACRSQAACVAETCFCADGYIFNSTSASCEDVDECAAHLDDCPDTLRCANRPGGFVCVCPDGFRQTTRQAVNITSRYDTIECDDIDECDEDMHSCPFTCRNTPGSYECACKAGYMSDDTKRLCVPLGPSSLLLVAAFGRFHFAEINMTTGELEFEPAPMYCEVATSSVFAYHQSRAEVYFASDDLTTIYRSALNGSCQQLVSGRKRISALELDWIYGKMYWADESGVTVAELNGDFAKTILGFEEGRPAIENMVVNPFNGWLLFTTHDGQAWRVGLDGTHMGRVFDGTNVTVLVFDVEESNIAMQTDSDLLLCPEDTTASSDVCTELAMGLNGTLTLLDMFMDFAVFEDESAGTLLLVSRNGKHVLRLRAGNSTFRSLRGRVLHVMKQPGGGGGDGRQRCHSGCSHLCVNSPSIARHSCLCPDDRPGDECTQLISFDLATSEARRVGSVTMLTIGTILTVLGSLCILYGLFARWRDRQRVRKELQPDFRATLDASGVQLSAVDSFNYHMGHHLVQNEVPPDVVHVVPASCPSSQ